MLHAPIFLPSIVTLLLAIPWITVVVAFPVCVPCLSRLPSEVSTTSRSRLFATPAASSAKKFKNFDELLKKHDEPIIVNFHTTYCGPCGLLKKELAQVQDTLQGKIHVFNIDVERFPSLGTRFKVSALPTLVVFKNGEIVHRIVGVEDTDSILRQLSELL